MRTVSSLLVTALTMVVVTNFAAEAHGSRGSRASGAAAARSAAEAPARTMEGALQVNSKAISPGGEIPKRETCDGQNSSPPLAWSDPPASVKSFVLVLDDPDAPGGTFTHWLLWDIPDSARELPEGLPATPQIAGGGTQGRNDFGKIGYGGPCPPPGKPHRYFFRLYALDISLALKPGASRRELERAMKNHVLASAELMGRYRR